MSFHLYKAGLASLVYILVALELARADQHPARHPRAHSQHRDTAGPAIDEREIPITATTTVVVDVTMTQTIWVDPTGQHPFAPGVSRSSAISEIDITSTDEPTSAFTTVLPSNELLPSAQSASSLDHSTLWDGEAGEKSGSNAALASRTSGYQTSRASATASVQDVDTPPSYPTSLSSVISATSNAPRYSRSSGYHPSSSSTSLDELSSQSVSPSPAVSNSHLSSIGLASVTSSASPSSTVGSIGGRLMNAYYPDWSGWYLAPESVDWSRYDVIDFAFALPTIEGGLQFTQDDSSALLTRLVNTGHAAGKRVKLSIGGWTGSAYFSTICADSTTRATFVANIVKAYQAYNLDGIDIDWEYPGTGGAAGNAISPDDSANYLVFLQDLRKALPQNALITAATQVWPFAGPNGQPLSDVSGFAKVLDWILIMNYDIWGSSSTPGANAPLSDACHNSTQPLANAYAAVSSWTTAGMPANQITLGVPAYGYLQMSSASSLRTRRSSFPEPHVWHAAKRNATDTLAARGFSTVYNDNGGNSDGQVMFESLITQGALIADGGGGYIGSNGFERFWDSCSSTPWIKSTQSGQIITYDDTESMSLKGQFAAQAGLKGCNIFSIDGDWTGHSWPLTDAVRSGMGL